MIAGCLFSDLLLFLVTVLYVRYMVLGWAGLFFGFGFFGCDVVACYLLVFDVCIAGGVFWCALFWWFFVGCTMAFDCWIGRRKVG